MKLYGGHFSIMDVNPGVLYRTSSCVLALVHVLVSQEKNQGLLVRSKSSKKPSLNNPIHLCIILQRTHECWKQKGFSDIPRNHCTETFHSSMIQCRKNYLTKFYELRWLSIVNV